jgi:hypothetical protein
MKREMLEVYSERIPEFTQVGENREFYFGLCPFCGDDTFRIWGDGHFECSYCDAIGGFEDFVTRLKALGVYESETGKDGEIREAEAVDGPAFGKILQPEKEDLAEIVGEEPQREREHCKVSSDLKIPEEISRFLTLDLPGRELQILLLLQIRRNGFRAKEIGEELQIPQSNVHRYLAALEAKRLIYSEGKPKRYFKIDDGRLMGRFRRGSITSKLTKLGGNGYGQF